MTSNATEQRGEPNATTAESALRIVREHSGKAQAVDLRFLQAFGVVRSLEPSDADRPPLPQVRIAGSGSSDDQCIVRVHTRWLIKHDQLKGIVAGWEATDVVDISSVIECFYQLNDGHAMSNTDRDVLCRVSAVYHGWPYFREFAHSTLGRMQLPPLPVIVLNIGTAIAMAGYRPSEMACENKT